MAGPLSVYVHIPFCVRKCLYCDFLSFPLSGQDVLSKYSDVLSLEIKSSCEAYARREVETVFFGGGTPTILNTEQLTGILRIIKECVNVSENAEITVEANPGTVDERSLYGLRLGGFNRISFGLQSNINRLLKLMGRIYEHELFDSNFHAARKAGFQNINVDIIHSLPCQSADDWRNTLEYVIGKGPEHISAYGLIPEEGTGLFEAVSDGRLSLPDEDLQLEMCRIAEDTLDNAGYMRYEISNYAKPGFNCRHNMTYWRCMEYVGFGLGAVSRVGSVRFSNETDLGKYLGASFEKHDKQIIGREDAISEFMFLGLRMMEGVSKKEFFERFGAGISDVYGEAFISLINAGLIEQNNGRIYLTKRGVDVSNRVFSELLL